jgi:hypothetical protein
VYLGRYILLDPRTKGQDYFGRISNVFYGMLSGGMLPDEIEINVDDGFDEDSAWALARYKALQGQQIVNQAHCGKNISRQSTKFTKKTIHP